jgi:hypothetical protein
MPVVFEARPESHHLSVEFLLAAVAERGMAEIVRQRQSLCVLFVKVQGRRDGARDLGYLNRVGQPIAEMVTQPDSKHLCFALKPSKGSRVDDTVAIALEIVAIGMRWLRKTPAAAWSGG